MTLNRIHLKGHLGASNSEGWLEGDDRVFVSVADNCAIVDFKVIANAPEGRTAVEYLMGAVLANEGHAEFFIEQTDDGAMLLTKAIAVDGYQGPVYEIGMVPPILVAKVLLPKWDLIKKHAVLAGFAVELSTAGSEIGPMKMMRMADHEEDFDAMSQEEFDDLMGGLVDGLRREVYVVKVRMKIEAKDLEKKMLEEHNNGS